LVNDLGDEVKVQILIALDQVQLTMPTGLIPLEAMTAAQVAAVGQLQTDLQW